MEGTRVPVSTREDGPSPSRKGKKRVYGAQRTESGLNIVEGGDPGKYIMTSPATKEAFERAVDAMAFGQVEETDPPVSETVRDRATVAINAISAEARAEADEGEGAREREAAEHEVEAAGARAKNGEGRQERRSRSRSAFNFALRSLACAHESGWFSRVT